MTLEEFRKAYAIESKNEYMHYKIFIEFKHGSDYKEEGLMTLEHYNWLKFAFSRNHKLFLGEINGKHSEGRCYLDDFTFSNDNDKIETYIKNHGHGAEFFSDRMTECTKKCEKACEFYEKNKKDPDSESDMDSDSDYYSKMITRVMVKKS